MKTRMSSFAALPAAILGLGIQSVFAQAPAGNPQESEAILKKAGAFVEAFAQADPKALAAFWTSDGDYTDQTGRHLKGREAIANAFAELFSENKGLKLRIDSASLRFVSPDVAVEDGTTAVIPPDGAPPSRAKYTIVHVKRDGQWYLSSVRDSVFPPPTNYQFLRPLEWMVGQWADVTPEGEIARVSFHWAENQNFLICGSMTMFRNVSVAASTEWIGWDPLAGRIRSWTFEAQGGFGEGSWAIDGNKVVVKTTTVLRDGRKLIATNIVTRTDPNTLTWESKDRTLDGKAIPPIAPVTMKRQNP